MIRMKKSTLKIAAVLSSLAICITAFAACSQEKNENKLVYEEGGKIYYRKDVGEDAYELATDKNGVTLVDEQGNLLWKVTNAQGEEQTHPVSFPAYIDDGDSVSCQQFSMTLPRGWSNTGKTMIMLRSKDGEKKIDYSFFEPNEDGSLPTGASKTEELEKLFASAIADGTAKITSSSVQVGGRDATKVVLVTEGKKTAYLEVYYVDTNLGLMAFSCACPFEDGGDFDFKAILDTIEYRI